MSGVSPAVIVSVRLQRWVGMEHELSEDNSLSDSTMTRSLCSNLRPWGPRVSLGPKPLPLGSANDGPEAVLCARMRLPGRSTNAALISTRSNALFLASALSGRSGRQGAGAALADC